MAKDEKQIGDEQALVNLLVMITVNDSDYDLRNMLIIDALCFAQHLGYESGIGRDPEEPDWPVVFIDLPSGQVSWHIPGYQKSWDGHSTEVKKKRIQDYLVLMSKQA